MGKDDGRDSTDGDDQLADLEAVRAVCPAGARHAAAALEDAASASARRAVYRPPGTSLHCDRSKVALKDSLRHK